MNDRELALWWFAGFREALSSHYQTAFLDQHELNLRECSPAQLLDLRATWKRSAVEFGRFAIDTDEPDHNFAQTRRPVVTLLVRHTRVCVALSALYLLATGDKGRTEVER